MTASVRPLPDYFKLIGETGISRGEQVGTLNIWPTARPVLSLERGKSAVISLRIRPLEPATATLKLSSGTPESVKLRQDAKQQVYWLDIPVGPFAEPGIKNVPVSLDSSDGNKIAVMLSVNIPAEDIIITPRELDLGKVALSSAAASGALRGGRFGIRKLTGAFKIKSLSSTLDFIKLEPQTIIEGGNYLVRIRIAASATIKAGAYSGVVRIETDTGQMLEVPIKITFVE